MTQLEFINLFSEDAETERLERNVSPYTKEVELTQIDMSDAASYTPDPKTTKNRYSDEEADKPKQNAQKNNFI